MSACLCFGRVCSVGLRMTLMAENRREEEMAERVVWRTKHTQYQSKMETWASGAALLQGEASVSQQRIRFVEKKPIASMWVGEELDFG